MMRSRIWTGLALAGVAATALVAAAPAPRAPIARDGLALPATTTLAQAWVTDRKVPGMVIAVGRGDAAPAYASAGALAYDAGAAAAGPDTLWRIYSMTKPVTGIAAMMLVEEGRLKLDQPIADLLPAFRNMRVLTDPENSLDSRPAKNPITVRHLLTHTAGLGYNIITKGPLLNEYNRLGINPAAVNPLIEMGAAPLRPRSLAEFADRVATLPLIAEPGTRWSYSIALDLLPRVIEVASGMNYESFLETRLLKPLGMTSTWFTVPPTAAPRLATNYFWNGTTPAPLDTGAASVWLRPPSFPYGGAGLISTAHDYDRFLRMLLNGGTIDGVRILKPETVRLAMSDLLPASADTSLLTAIAGQLGARIGFGAGGSVYLSDLPGGPARGTFGWAGAAGSLGWVDPVNKVRGTIMVNYMPSDKWPLRAEAMRAIYTDLKR